MTQSWEAPGDCAQCHPSRAARLAKCPACGRPLHRSGPAIPLPELPAWIDRPLSRWLRGRELREIALYLACVPLLIALPILSLAMFAFRYYRAPSRTVVIEWKLVLIAACLNLVISIYLLAQISDLFWLIGLDGIQSLWQIILPYGPAAPTDPKSIPV